MENIIDGELSKLEKKLQELNNNSPKLEKGNIKLVNKHSQEISSTKENIKKFKEINRTFTKKRNERGIVPNYFLKKFAPKKLLEQENSFLTKYEENHKPSDYVSKILDKIKKQNEDKMKTICI